MRFSFVSNKLLGYYLSKYSFHFLFITLGILFMLWGRWDSIVYPYLLNPDEAQAAANAIRIRAYGFSWDATDGTSVGPYNSLVLCWPYLFGGDVTYSTVRLTVFILLWAIISHVYYSINVIAGRFYAMLYTFPLILFYALTEHYDFLHYSSEIFPIFLLATANTIAIVFYKNRRFNYILLALAGVTAGMAPFAKLQSAPISVLITTFIMYLLYRGPSSGKKYRILLFILSLLIPGIVLLVPILISNNIEHFYNSYILWAFIYIQDSLTFTELYELMSQENLFKSIFIFYVSLIVTTIILKAIYYRKQNTPNLVLVIYSIGMIVVSIYVINRPGNSFTHYLNFLLPFMAVMIGIISIKISQRTKLYYGVLYFSFAGIFILNPSIILFNLKKTYSSPYRSQLEHHFKWKNANAFSWMSPDDTDNFLIWGWMPQWYLLGNKIPATRETHTYTQIIEHRLSDYYRKRFMVDIKKSSPDIIINAITGNSFYFNDPNKYGRFFPEFSTYVKNKYVELNPANRKNNKCPTVYVSNERYKTIKGEIVEFKSITEITTNPHRQVHPSVFVTNIDDYSVTEDSCIDYWLLPAGTLGAIDISFQSIQEVSEIMFLNTHNSYQLNRATKDIRFSLYNKGREVSTQEIRLNSFPEPTKYTFPNTHDADQLIIEILSYDCFGAGLNEVKVFRAKIKPSDTTTLKSLN